MHRVYCSLTALSRLSAFDDQSQVYPHQGDRSITSHVDMVTLLEKIPARAIATRCPAASARSTAGRLK